MLTADSQIHPADTLGQVISVKGSQAQIGLLGRGQRSTYEARATVGGLITIHSGKSRVIGVITEVSTQNSASHLSSGGEAFAAIAVADLMGEITQSASGAARFQRGVSLYPTIGDGASMVSNQELRVVYDVSRADTINIGNLQQDPTIPAYIDVNEMLSKHFAVLGTTGVGKSSGVVLILQEILKARPDLRLFLLDVHNEYGRCFGDKAQVLNPRNLKLPFWLFNFEETIDVLFAGRPGVPEEVEILSEAIPQARVAYTQYQSSDRSLAKRIDPKSMGFTADTPVPYRLQDLVALIDERMGKLENRSSRLTYHKLMQRIETVRNDGRYAFMYENANVGGDTMAEVISQLFRLPANGKPMTIMQLAGFPAEVVDSVVSVLCRMAFDFGLWSDGASPLLFVCEEAHRYASADRTIGFGPTRKAISRIAKEGRKYGVFLGLVTQRPAELDPTIISQCSTLLAMRMANDRDQALLRSAVSDAAANLLSFVPSLGTREVLAFGEGVALPTRLRFKELRAADLPRSEAVNTAVSAPVAGANDVNFVASVLARWRGASAANTQSFNQSFDQSPMDRPPLRVSEAPSYQPAHGLDPDRFKILKKSITAPLG